jgi:CheY-like chemotaxis protein
VNVLLIEPDRVLGQTTKTTLEAVGCQVVWKRTAQTALDALDNSLPDVVVLEIQLGEHNGVEFLYEVLSYPEWQHIPMVVHTINAKAQDDLFANSFAQLGVKAILYKPKTSMAQLVKAVKQVSAVT